MLQAVRRAVRPVAGLRGYLVGTWVVIATATTACAASVVDRGLIDCFTPLLTRDNGELLHCEASAAMVVADELLLAIDKPVPGIGRSSLLLMKQVDGVPRAWSNRYLGHAAILAARKIEGMTVTPEGKWILAATAFDRMKDDIAEWDGYNMLLAWRVEKDWETQAQVLALSYRDGVVSSSGLREKFHSALGSVSYAKIEGLAMLPDGSLLFGVRNVGSSFKDEKPVVKILSVATEIVDDESPALVGDPKLAYEPPEALDPEGREVGLSSIEYDPFNDRLYLLTSYEEEEKTDEGLGGYLWTLPMADFRNKAMPTLVRDETGAPLHFAHKPEGLAVIDKDHVLVIHDDDRVLGREVVEDPRTQFSRRPHQAAYTVVRVE